MGLFKRIWLNLLVLVPLHLRLARSADEITRCFRTLFHGKYDAFCLAEQNITRTPCVRPLLITGTGGSGTARTAALFGAAGFSSVWQDHETMDETDESEVLTSWFSRTDVEGLRRASGFHWPWKARFWEVPAAMPPSGKNRISCAF